MKPIWNKFDNLTLATLAVATFCGWLALILRVLEMMHA